MSLKKLLGIEELERENQILFEYVKEQNLRLQSIYATTKKYQKENNAIAHVGFQKIENLTVQALDFAAQKEIELANVE